MRYMVYVNHLGWVSEDTPSGFTATTINAKPFDSPADARKFCEGEADLQNSHISILGFVNSEVVGLKQLFSPASRRAHMRIVARKQKG